MVVGDGTSVNLFKTVAAALWLRPDRRVVVAEAGNFPTDGYIAQGVVDLVDGASLRMVDVDDPAALAAALEPGDVAVVLLSHVDYRTGILRDMAAVTEMVHAHGALVVWDVCHSVGAVPPRARADGCGLRRGLHLQIPQCRFRAPAFTYVARRHHERVRQPISGWHGHARPFDFAPEYEPAAGASRFLSGSQSLIAAAALEASLELWQRVDLAQVREKSLALTDLFVAVTAEAGLECVTPAEHERRGSQVALRHPDGYPIVQALIARGVVGDFRSPDILRFGFAPLYLRYVDVYDAARALVEVVTSGEWQDPRFAQRAQVTGALRKRRNRAGGPVMRAARTSSLGECGREATLGDFTFLLTFGAFFSLRVLVSGL